jgi:hypothetical protein
MKILYCAVSVVLINLVLIASGCGIAEDAPGKNVSAKKASSVPSSPTHHPAILVPLKTSLNIGDAKVTDESIEFLDGGTFGFAVAYGSTVRYVMFPHPSIWNETQKSSKKAIVLWNTKPSAPHGIDITQDDDLLQCLDSILIQSKVVRSVWRHECARVAFSGRMIWTQSGMLVVPDAAKQFVSQFTRIQANSQYLKNSLRKYHED